MARKKKLPLYKFIPAAKSSELTPANGLPRSETFLTWHRSHGDNGGRRYSGLDQINRQTVTNLAVAWVYGIRGTAATKSNAIPSLSGRS